MIVRTGRLYSEEISAASAAEQQRHAASEEEHARLSAELETLRQPPPAVTSGPLDFASTPTTMLDSVDGEDNEEEEDQQEPEESAPPPAATISSEAQTAATSNPAEMQALSDEFTKLVSDVAETQALMQLKIKTQEDHAREEQQLRDSEAAAIRQHVQKGAREAIESHADVLLEHLETAEQDWYKERQLLMSIDVTASLDEPGELGLRWAYDARLGGVVVQAVEPHSQAQRSPRLCVGLVLKTVGGVQVSGLSYAETLKQLATEDRPLELRLTPAALPVPPRQVPPLIASLQEEGPLGIGFKFDKISRHVFVESVKPSSQASRQPRIQPGKLSRYSRHLGCILAIWVVFFSSDTRGWQGLCWRKWARPPSVAFPLPKLWRSAAPQHGRCTWAFATNGAARRLRTSAARGRRQARPRAPRGCCCRATGTTTRARAMAP